ncbi:hypothetical protein [Paraburkholderia hiiakae]|nr:hypothetical protein [Paraburkholderia hiiakae]
MTGSDPRGGWAAAALRLALARPQRRRDAHGDDDGFAAGSTADDTT